LLKAPLELAQHSKVERGGQQHEDARDKENGDVLLEGVNVAQGIQPHVGDGHAHHRDGEQTGFLLDHVGEDERADHRHQQDGRLEIFRHMSAREGPGDGAGHGIADEPRHERGSQEGGQHRKQRAAFSRPPQVFVSDDGAERAEGIVDDRFPFQDRARPRRDVALAQQGNDHGGSGHHQNACEQDRDGPDQPRDVVAGHGAKHPAHGNTYHHQARHRAFGLSEFAEIEAEAAFEQDQRHRDRDHRFQQVTESVFGNDEAGDGTCKDTGGEHEGNGRPTGTPRDPLRADTEEADQREDEGLLLHDGRHNHLGQPR
jgi:hypothetical protein